VRRIRLLRQQAEVESGGSPADANDLQARPLAMDAVVYSAGAETATRRSGLRRSTAIVQCATTRSGTPVTRTGTSLHSSSGGDPLR
jgi:hypothetical protein